MDPRDFLACARSLFDPPAGAPPPSPADCRSAISRSYYAALNVAAALVDGLKIPLDKQKESHKHVTDLVASGQDDLVQACTLLAFQKEVRKLADYDMGNPDVETRLKASQSFLACARIIDLIDAVRNDKGRWKIAAARIRRQAKVLGLIT